MILLFSNKLPQKASHYFELAKVGPGIGSMAIKKSTASIVGGDIYFASFMLYLVFDGYIYRGDNALSQKLVQIK